MAFFRRHRRKQLRQKAFPEPWRALVEEHVAYYRLLSSEEQRDLLGHMQVFLAEKHFEGCGGLELTDAMRLTVAAYACLLMLNRDLEYFPRLSSILLYPSAYVVPDEQEDEAGVVTESDSVHLGESWSIGAVVLSWDDVRRDAGHLDGHNVVLHEFAHQIDRADGASDGWPDHIEHNLQDRWLEIMGREFEELKTAVHRGRPASIDPYGATNPAEFFAVLTEAFFTSPVSLHRNHPDLYNLFREFYEQDPLDRLRQAGGGLK